VILSAARRQWPTALGEAFVVWLLAGPPALGYGGVHAALGEHIALAMALGALVAIAGVLRAANLTCALLGGWLAISPWVLGYASRTTAGTLNDVLSGLALLALSAVQHGRARRGTGLQF
jgi:hypothetical protein